MNVIKNTHNTNAVIPHVNGENFLAKRIGFWATVSEQNSKNNTVTVISDTGFELPNIPVVSGEWVTVDKNKDYIPSTRNLPPKGSRVFVLTPTYSAMGAFVLCSGFSKGDENIRTLWAQNDNEVEDKNNSRETKTQGGWDITEEYENGNFAAKSDDENIIITVNTTKNEDKSQEKEVSILAWENSIIINEDGIKITDCNDNIFLADDEGLKITDKNDNEIKANNDGLKITDKNDNEIKTTNTGIKITDKNNNVIELKQNECSIKVGNSVIKLEPTKVSINGHLEVSV